MSALDHAKIAEVAALLKKARSALFITGAGLSADSDLPTYRGVGGLYEGSETEDGMPIEEALSGRMLAIRPELVWRHISQIEAACRGARPNRGHEVIAALEQRLPRVWTLTQNVDGFHRRAGSRNLIEVHGHIHTMLCTGCEGRFEIEGFHQIDIPPKCGECGAVVRPDVVLFGETLPFRAVAMMRHIGQEGFDIVFSVGTSSLFQYIVDPVLEAKRWGVPTVEINPGPTDLSQMVDYKFAARAAEALDAIFQASGW